MPTFTLTPSSFVASSVGNDALATGAGTSWIPGLVLTSPGLTISVRSVDVVAQTASLSVSAGNTPGAYPVSDGQAGTGSASVSIAPLISTDYLLAQALAGDRVLSPGQLAALASKAAEASAIVRRWCGDRDFSRQVYTQRSPPALDGTVMLRQFPVNRVLRASGSRSAGLVVTNSDRANNTRATAGFASAGDESTGIAFTGLSLVRVTSGVAVEAVLDFAAYPTLSALANAVAALGHGWGATVAAGLESWPSTDLVGGDVTGNALSGAELEVFAEDLDDCRLDRPTGRFSVGYRGGVSRFDGPRWGPYQDQAQDDDARQGPVFVRYDAGFDAIPEPVRQATAIIALGLLDKLAVDGSLASVNLGNTTFSRFSPELISAVPKSARDYLAPYRIVRV